MAKAKKKATLKAAPKKAKPAKAVAVKAKAPKKAVAPVKAAVKKTAAPKGKGNSAFMKPLAPSPDLAKIVGPASLARTEVVKKLWQYIKKNNLQDPKNKRNIIADELLKPIFGGKNVVSMFEMTKLISKHLK